MAKSGTQPQAEQWGEEIGSAELVKWDRPKVLIGIYEKGEVVTSGQYATPENPSFRITLTQDDGETIATYAPSGLASRIQQVAPGTRVRIEYDGTTSKSKAGRDVKNFSVRTALDMAAAAAELSAPGGRF